MNRSLLFLRNTGSLYFQRPWRELRMQLQRFQLFNRGRYEDRLARPICEEEVMEWGEKIVALVKR
jgi:hypothetical protein